jgi:hypothetical protein
VRFRLPAAERNRAHGRAALGALPDTTRESGMNAFAARRDKSPDKGISNRLFAHARPFPMLLALA